MTTETDNAQEEVNDMLDDLMQTPSIANRIRNKARGLEEGAEQLRQLADIIEDSELNEEPNARAAFYSMLRNYEPPFAPPF